MAGLVELSTTSVDAQPGEEAEIGVLVYNLGAEPEAFELTVEGPAAPWAFLDPAVVRLEAGGSSTVRLLLRPPRGHQVPAGPTPFVVRLASRLTRSDEEVAEGTVDVEAFEAFTARLVPDVVEAATAGRARIEIENDGNVPIVVNLAATSPDGAIVLRLEDETVLVPAGTGTSVKVKLKPLQRRLWGRGEAAAYAVRLETLTRVATLSGRLRPRGALVGLALRGLLVGVGLVGVAAGARTAFAGDEGERRTSKGLPVVIRSTTVPVAPAVVGISGAEEAPPATSPAPRPAPGTPASPVPVPPGAQSAPGTLPPAPAEQRGPASAAVLHRLYDPALVDYLYTTDPGEAGRLAPQGVVDQGSVGRVLTTRAAGTVPLYRLRRPDGRHLFTFDEGERRAAVLQGATQEGITGYLWPAPTTGTTPLYRMSKAGTSYLTADQADVDARIAAGWVNEGVRGYVLR